MPYHQKLIEVAQSLDAINAESAREKSICHGLSNWLRQFRFDNSSYSCYKLDTSPLFLRGQGARRLTTASAFLILSGWSCSQVER